MRRREGPHAEIVKELLAKGAEKDAQEMFGDTPLICAAEKGHTEIVKQLLATGAKKNAQSHRGRTALMKARSPVMLMS